MNVKVSHIKETGKKGIIKEVAFVKNGRLSPKRQSREKSKNNSRKQKIFWFAHKPVHLPLTPKDFLCSFCGMDSIDSLDTEEEKQLNSSSSVLQICLPRCLLEEGFNILSLLAEKIEDRYFCGRSTESGTSPSRATVPSSRLQSEF